MLGRLCLLTGLVMLDIERVWGQHETFGVNSSNFKYSTYLPHVITCHASQRPLIPSSVADLQLIVEKALQSSLTLKPLGNRHSLTDIICTDGIPISMEAINHFRYDQITGIATVGAGSTLHDFLKNLHKIGRTISSGIPAFMGITVGGAMGSGAHGTAGRSGTGTMSDLVDSLVVVDGLGNVRNISDPTLLRAFKPHLGLLGIVFEVRFRTVAQFKMQIRHFPVDDDILFNSNKIMEYVRASDRFQMWWFPLARQVVMSVGIHVPLSTPGACETHYIPEVAKSTVILVTAAVETMQEEKNHLGLLVLQTLTSLALYQRVPGRTPIFHDPGQLKVMCSTVPAVGYYYKMVANKCDACVWHYGNDSILLMEYAVAVPLRQFPAALNTISEILREYPVEFPYSPLFIRYLPKSDGLLMVNGDRDTMMVEWALSPRKEKNRIGMMGLAASQAMSQALIERHNGKPHWAKNGKYYSSNSIVRKAYPNLPEFLHRMDEFDPRGVFLNNFGRRLLFGSVKLRDVPVQHCALEDDCICDKDDDCGDPDRKGALLCGELKGFRVCREPDYNYKSFQTDAVRNVIKKWQSLLTENKSDSKSRHSWVSTVLNYYSRLFLQAFAFFTEIIAKIVIRISS